MRIEHDPAKTWRDRVLARVVLYIVLGYSLADSIMVVKRC